MFFLCSCTLNWVGFWWHNSFSYTFLLTLVNCLKIDIGFFLKTLLAKYCKNFDGVRISPAINLSGVPSFFGYQKIGRAAICHIFPAKDDLSRYFIYISYIKNHVNLIIHPLNVEICLVGRQEPPSTYPLQSFDPGMV